MSTEKITKDVSATFRGFAKILLYIVMTAEVLAWLGLLSLAIFVGLHTLNNEAVLLNTVYLIYALGSFLVVTIRCLWEGVKFSHKLGKSA